MDFEDGSIRHNPLDTGWSRAARLSIQAKNIRGAQATMGDNNTDNSLYRHSVIPTIPSPNFKSRLALKGMQQR